jgi:hypothetical protein
MKVTGREDEYNEVFMIHLNDLTRHNRESLNILLVKISGFEPGKQDVHKYVHRDTTMKITNKMQYID